MKHERRALALAVVSIAGAGLAAALARRPGPIAAGAEALYEDAVMALTGWELPGRAAPYRARIEEVELAYGIPAGLLARVLYQESRFREDIITGATVSAAGARGIAQLMPATERELGVDALDPMQAIEGAGRYLRRLFDALGGWRLALAAYNWGIGNVQRRGFDQAPRETREYVAAIAADVGLA